MKHARLALLFLAIATALPAARAESYQPRLASGELGSIERLDPGLDALIDPDAKLEILATGLDWSEGPVWVANGGHLLFSDVPRNVVWRWHPGEGLTEFLKPSDDSRVPGQGSNGLILDSDGNLLLCQHGSRQVARRTGDRIEPVATRYNGRRFNSPNDVVVHSSGDLYFTDPPYGLPRGADDPGRELDFSGVFRIARDGTVSLLSSNLTRPNGLAFSPDESRLYVAVSDPERAHYVVYDVHGDGTLARERVLFDATPLVARREGLPDGIKVDVHGNIWGTGPGGVLILTPDGRHLGTILTGRATGNCAWGGDGTVLYITADDLLCRIQTRTRGTIPGAH